MFHLLDEIVHFMNSYSDHKIETNFFNLVKYLSIS